MEYERSEPTPTMDSDERTLWKMVDVRGYAALAMMLENGLRALHAELSRDEFTQRNRARLDDSLDHILRSVTALSDRISLIDLGRLDERFPLDLLRTLTEDVPLRLTAVLDLMDELDLDAVPSDQVLERLREAHETVPALLGNLARAMGRHPRYQQARAQIPSEERY